jgi:hypothetical protein
MEYIDSPSPNAFRKWVKRHGVPHFRYGRELRFLRRDLDAALELQQRPEQSQATTPKQSARTSQRVTVASAKPSQSQHSERSLHHAGVSQQAIRDVHARQSDESADARHLNSVERGARW